LRLFLGELTISLRNRSADVEQLYLSYGTWGEGWLNENPTFASAFELEITTDLIQEVYIFAKVETAVFIDFLEPDSLFIMFFTDEVSEFIKDLSLEDLPVQPWDPSSCGPELVA